MTERPTRMFPLGKPLLPGAVLSLHVFEERYRQMMHDILADDDRPPEFGVAMIDRGTEVGGGDQRSFLATMARVVDIKAASDGRYGLVIVGVSRLRVLEWLDDDPYPQAVTELWPDEPGPQIGDASIESMRRRIEDLNAERRSLGEAAPSDDVALPEALSEAVYALAILAPIVDADRQRILAAPSLADRLRVLDDALDDAAAVLKFRRS